MPLRDRALASPGPLGTTFDPEGHAGHILDPRTGRPAACLLDAEGIAALVASFPDARLMGLDA